MTFKVLFGMTCKMPPSEMKYMKDKRFKGVGGKIQFEVPEGHTGMKTIYKHRAQGRAKTGILIQKSSACRC